MRLFARKNRTSCTIATLISPFLSSSSPAIFAFGLTNSSSGKNYTHQFSSDSNISDSCTTNNKTTQARSALNQSTMKNGYELSSEIYNIDTGSAQHSSHQLYTYHFSNVESTQDEARKILKQNTSSMSSFASLHSFLAVSTREQSKGRGTKGRDWIGRRGNTFVTIALPMTMLTNTKENRKSIPISLLPLKVGSVVTKLCWQMIHSSLSSSTPERQDAKVTVKWPNDVLVNGDKVAGVLIENQVDQNNNIWFLIGVGVNVAHAPPVDSTGPHRGRKSTCLKDHFSRETKENGFDDEQQELLHEKRAKELGLSISREICSWVVSDNDERADGIVGEWEQWAEFGQKLVLRDLPNDETVTTIAIEPDGQLRVKDQYGNMRLLNSDYLL